MSRHSSLFFWKEESHGEKAIEAANQGPWAHSLADLDSHWYWGALQCWEQGKWRTIVFQSLEGKSLSDLKGHLDRKLLTLHMNLLSGNIQVHELRRRVRKYTEGGKLDPACGKIAWRKWVAQQDRQIWVEVWRSSPQTSKHVSYLVPYQKMMSPSTPALIHKHRHQLDLLCFLSNSSISSQGY